MSSGLILFCVLLWLSVFFLGFDRCVCFVCDVFRYVVWLFLVCALCLWIVPCVCMLSL